MLLGILSNLECTFTLTSPPSSKCEPPVVPWMLPEDMFSRVFVEELEVRIGFEIDMEGVDFIGLKVNLEEGSMVTRGESDDKKRR